MTVNAWTAVSYIVSGEAVNRSDDGGLDLVVVAEPSAPTVKTDSAPFFVSWALIRTRTGRSGEERPIITVCVCVANGQ